MPEVKFSRDLQRMDCLGLDLNRPVDSTKEAKFPYLKNCRSFLAGRIEPRDGITSLGQVVAGQTPVHSCRRLNDPNTAFDPNSGGISFTRILGAGTHLAYGQTAPYTDADSGYSGDPMALVPWTPVGAPTAYMYVGDSARMRKIRVGGQLDTIGYAPPNIAPTVALTNVPNYKVIDSFQVTTGWVGAFSAANPTLVSRSPGGSSGTTTTVANILYDTGSTGWASVNLTSMVNIGQGQRLLFNKGGGTVETVTVQEVFEVSSATTIAGVVYDSGTSGACSIALTTPIDQIAIDGLLNNSTISENVRVVGISRGPDGTMSIRAVTVGTFAATNVIQLLASFRAYFVNNHIVTDIVQDDANTSAITAGVGTLTKTAALDLSHFDTNATATGTPVMPNDFMHIALLVSAPQSLVEIKIQLDVDATGASQDFMHNFYFKSFHASDLADVVINTQSVLQSRQQTLQNIILNSPTASAITPLTQQILAGQVIPEAELHDINRGNPILTGSLPVTPDVTAPILELNQVNASLSEALASGNSQWVDLTFRISELTRVGTDTTRSLANVDQIQIVVTANASLTLQMTDWWIGGGFGPDTTDTTATGYSYRYRVRHPLTNVPSNFSPATRLLVSPERQSVTLGFTQYAAPSGTTLAATDLVIDIARFGGQIADWHYVATIPNSATPSFVDIYADDVVGGNPILDNSNYQPWPIIGVPVTGTTGTVAGTSIKDSGTNFNTSWAQGTRILINNQPYTIYRVVSTSFLEIVENAGSQTAQVWRIDQPTILAQPLPVLWFDEGEGLFFAAGDPTNPGRLYYTNPSSETTTPANYLDVTSPSEPLMNGCAYNARSYIFSSENFFQILSTSSFEAIANNSQLATAPLAYVAQKIPHGKGLFSRWGMTIGATPVICFLAKDGINMTTGGAPTALTDADMYELFPNEGNLGVNVNGIGPPNVISANAASLRLHYYDEYLYFDYIDTNSNRATLVLNFDLGAAVRGQAPGGWFWDIYGGGGASVNSLGVFHYGDEGAAIHALLIGGVDGLLYQYMGNSDNGVAFGMEFTTPSRDQGDPRSNKLYGDVMLDSNTGGLNASVTPFLNNNATALTTVIVNTPVRAQNGIPLGTSWQTAKNISLFVHVDVSTSVRPFFYIWEPRWTFESAPISALSWEISPTTFGMDDFKHVGLCKVTHVSTVNLSLIFTVDGVAQPTITIPNSSGVYAQTIFRVPVMKGKLYKLRIASADNATEFRLDTRDTSFEVKDWGSDGEYSKMRLFSDFSLVEG